MILIGLGANLPSARHGEPKATLAAALAALEAEGVATLARSRWYRTAPMPPSDQPWFVNAVAAVATRRRPAELLALLHEIEARFGRRRDQQRNEARPIDLDLLAYDDAVVEEGGLVLPHPRLHERAFVLLPLAEVAPGWRHPRLARTVEALIADLPADQVATPME